MTECDDNINEFIPSLLNPRTFRKPHDLSLTQNSVASRYSLSLKRKNGVYSTTKESNKKEANNKVISTNKENTPNNYRKIQNITNLNLSKNASKPNVADVTTSSLDFSAIEDYCTQYDRFSPIFNERCEFLELNNTDKDINKDKDNNSQESHLKNNTSHISISSATELNDEVDTLDIISNSEATILYEEPKSLVSVSFGVKNCDTVQVTSSNGAINNIIYSHKDNNTNIECDVIETSQVTTDSTIELDENMNQTSTSPKRPSVTVNLEIKKQKLSTPDSAENSKVLILNTNAIEKISHVIVQPPNYKFVKRNLNRDKSKINKRTLVNNGKNSVDSVYKQTGIDSFLCAENRNVTIELDKKIGCVNKGKDGKEMSKSSGVDGTKYERGGRCVRAVRQESSESPKSAKSPPTRESLSPNIKITNSEVPSPGTRNESASSQSTKKYGDSIHFSLSSKSAKAKPFSPRHIPHHKIVAGTHFAVDAFSYGDIPNVKHYFLTHFHSDHYSGLKKTFNKLLFCSKITAELCITRLGVNSKYIHVLNVDEILKVDGVEVTVVDANHCPGAVMLIFTLPNGKSLLHTGDFRGCPAMESYPIFWNKDIHTIYLDTTYCNPRYDFPTQEQSLEMALYILRQKKMNLEKVGKKFSSVLIVCGTYTIGKEKFFLGMARRVGCSVWACPEKERVLQTVEGRLGSREPPHACQLHVVPMRDLTHEKLRSYLNSLQGPFTEVVAFKPSGWENGKNSSVEKDSVTIHGIPYSEHSSFSELIRFVKFLKPKQVVPTVEISGGVKAVQKYFPCPLLHKDDAQIQSKVTDYFVLHNRQQVPAVT